MNAQLVKHSEERGYRARADRRITQGRVLSRNDKTQTVVLEVGIADAQGNPVRLVDIPYQPQSPPQVNDTVTIVYTNASPHSAAIGGSGLGSANQGQVIEVYGAAPKDAEYVVLAAHATLTAEVVLGTGVIMAGTDAGKPAASKAGRLYFATDTDRVYRDTGAAWVEMAVLARDHGHTTAADDGGALATPAVTNYIEMTEVAAPGTPAAGKVRIYSKSDNKVYRKGEDGVEAELGGTASPLTTKGDVWGYSTVNARVPVGSNDQVLTADSAQTLGVKWATPVPGWGDYTLQDFDGDGGATPTVGGDAVNNRTMVFCSTGGADWDLNLPAAAAGKWVYVRRYGNAAGTVEVKSAAGDNIEAGTSWSIGTDDAILLVARNATNWYIVAQAAP